MTSLEQENLGCRWVWKLCPLAFSIALVWDLCFLFYQLSLTWIIEPWYSFLTLEITSRGPPWTLEKVFFFPPYVTQAHDLSFLVNMEGRAGLLLLKCLTVLRSSWHEDVLLVLESNQNLSYRGPPLRTWPFGEECTLVMTKWSQNDVTSLGRINTLILIAACNRSPYRNHKRYENK